MGLARTPPQVVYPRSSFITPTQGAGTQSQPRQPLSRALPPPAKSSAEPPVTPVKPEKASAAPRSSVTRLEYPPLSAQSSSGEPGFTPLSARVTPVASARPILTASENGPLNAHINSLNKQLAELEAQRKDLNARLADSEKKLEGEIIRRERTIRELAAQHEQEKQEWKETFRVVCLSEIHFGETSSNPGARIGASYTQHCTFACQIRDRTGALCRSKSGKHSCPAGCADISTGPFVEEIPSSRGPSGQGISGLSGKYNP